MWPPVIFFMQSAGSAFIMSQSQLAIWADLSFTQTRTREVVLDLFGPGTWRVCHYYWPPGASCAKTGAPSVAAASELGRAWCRERLCREVKFSGGRGCIK